MAISGSKVVVNYLLKKSTIRINSLRYNAAAWNTPKRASSPQRKILKCTKPPKVLITGGMGQLGRSLASNFNYMYGCESVLLTDICKRPVDFVNTSDYCYLNIMDKQKIEEIVVNYDIDTLVHFSALLSAVGEKNIELALQINCQGVQNVLDVARNYKLKVFIPSTIGVFGESTPQIKTPDLTIQRPKTIYGVTKVFAELLGEYYFNKFNVDFRSLRFPGIISDIQPGGGTTDYAIQIFYDAILYGKHTCYLRPDTMLPMMYDTDCMASVINLLLTPSEFLSLRTYNVTGFSFSPQQLANAIQRIIPHFQIEYEICPIRQAIADSWPQSLDDSMAKRDWQWQPEFDLDKTVQIMLKRVSAKLKPSMHDDEIQQSTTTTQQITATICPDSSQHLGSCKLPSNGRTF